MNGRHEVRACTIEPALLGEDREMLEDLVAAAINDAVRKVGRGTEEKCRADGRTAAAAGHETAVLTGAAMTYRRHWRA